MKEGSPVAPDDYPPLPHEKYMDCISSGKSDECEFGQPYQEFSRVLAILFAHNTDSSAIRTQGDILENTAS